MLLAYIAALSALAAAQTILPTVPDATFPACGLTCTNLQNAQTLCIPPSAPVSDQLIYDQCFCQSALLSTLYSTPDGVCDAQCVVESDRQLLQSWYTTFCAQVAQSIIPTAAGAAATSSSTAISTSSSTSTSSTSSSTSSIDTSIYTTSSTIPAVVTLTATEATANGVTVVSPLPTTFLTSQSVVVVTVTRTNTAPVGNPGVQPTSAAGSTQTSNGPWIDTHWRWILMLGILILGLAFIALLAVCLKRRHSRKKEAQRAAASGMPQVREKGGRLSTATLEDMFGPHQHQALTRGFQYSHEQNRKLRTVGAMSSTIRQKSRERRERRREKRDQSAKRGQSSNGKDRHALAAAIRATEVDGSRDVQERPLSRKSTKSKTAKVVPGAELRAASSERSRSRRRRDISRPQSSRLAREKETEKDVDAIEKG